MFFLLSPSVKKLDRLTFEVGKIEEPAYHHHYHLIFWNYNNLLNMIEGNIEICCSEMTKKNSLMNFLDGWRKT